MCHLRLCTSRITPVLSRRSSHTWHFLFPLISPLWTQSPGRPLGDVLQVIPCILCPCTFLTHLSRFYSPCTKLVLFPFFDGILNPLYILLSFWRPHSSLNLFLFYFVFVLGWFTICILWRSFCTVPCLFYTTSCIYRAIFNLFYEMFLNQSYYLHPSGCCLSWQSRVLNVPCL